MSWWDINPEGDVIGDRPADILADTLGRLAETHERQNGERPSLKGLLAGLGAVLSSAAGHPLDVIAETPSGAIRADTPEAIAEGEQLTPALQGAMDRLAETYQERWERPPRAIEVAAAAAFVLRPDPGEYLRVSDAQTLDLDALRPEERRMNGVQGTGL